MSIKRRTAAFRRTSIKKGHQEPQLTPGRHIAASTGIDFSAHDPEVNSRPIMNLHLIGKTCRLAVGTVPAASRLTCRLDEQTITLSKTFTQAAGTRLVANLSPGFTFRDVPPAAAWAVSSDPRRQRQDRLSKSCTPKEGALPIVAFKEASTYFDIARQCCMAPLPRSDLSK
jgi:hypothetical protein